MIHGATGTALDLRNRRSADSGHFLCKQGVRGSSPLAPPGIAPHLKIVSDPFVAVVCSNESVLSLIEQPMQPGECIAAG